MNTNEISPKTSSRLNRIKTVSRIVRYAMLGLFIFAVGSWLSFLVFLSFPDRFYGTTQHTLLMVPLELVLSLWYWKLAKLFRFYERGLIFTNETIRCIKTLGILCVINWVLTSAYHVLSRWSASPADVTVKTVESGFGMGFFSFSIVGINVGLLLAGVIIVIIAWIMDEGRKIQEEQELTV